MFKMRCCLADWMEVDAVDGVTKVRKLSKDDTDEDRVVNKRRRGRGK